IIRGVLKMPSQLACIDVDRDSGIRVQVVSWSRLRIVLWDRIARAPNREPSRWIVRARLPNAPASGLPGIVLILPGLTARIAGFGYDIPPPQFLTRPGFQRRDPSARTGVACTIGDDDFVFRSYGRSDEFFFVAELVGGGHHLVPDDFAVI